MRPTRTTYRGFLLRMWWQDDGARVRSSIRDIDTGESRVFADLESLCTWLRRVAEADATPAETSSAPGARTDGG